MTQEVRRLGISFNLLSGTDIARFKELLQVFAEAFADPQAYSSAVPRDAYLQALLDKDHFLALAALDGSKVVGGLTAYVLDKFEQERKEIYIYDLAVLEAYRRRGIATGMINKVRTIVSERGAYVKPLRHWDNLRALQSERRKFQVDKKVGDG